MQARIAREGLIDKLDSLYRFRTKAPRWTICLDPLNSWGAHAITPKTLNPRYADRVVYNVGFFSSESTDASVPNFSLDTESAMMVWHEGSHIYTDALQQRYKADINKLAYLFDKTAAGMKRNSIEDWAHCFDENLVRGIVIALFQQSQRPAEARQRTAYEAAHDFKYAGDIADVLSAKYSGQRAYHDFEQFFPEILAYLAQKYPAPESTNQ